MSRPCSTALAWTASTSATSTEIPGAAMSSLPMMVTCAEGLVGDATVTAQPRSIATSKPSSETKKSRVASGRSDLMFGTVLLTVMFGGLPADELVANLDRAGSALGSVALDGASSGTGSARRPSRECALLVRSMPKLGRDAQFQRVRYRGRPVTSVAHDARRPLVFAGVVAHFGEERRPFVQQRPGWLAPRDEVAHPVVHLEGKARRLALVLGSDPKLGERRAEGSHDVGHQPDRTVGERGELLVGLVGMREEARQQLQHKLIGDGGELGDATRQRIG